MRLSAIVPVKNGEKTLEKCLLSIRQQTIGKSIEIIILDSCSTDKSVEIAKRYNAIIINIPNGTFNHGLTRNLGTGVATGDLLYYTVQDAYLAEESQLETMSDHFEDKDIMSVTGIQGIPNDTDKNPAIWFQRFSLPVPELRYFPDGRFKHLSLKEQLANCGWDNVNAMYRASAMKMLPFRETDFAEDALWARDALLQGWKIIRDSSLLVYHYHHQSFNYNFRASYILNYAYWKHFKVLPVMPALITAFSRNVFTIVKRSRLSILSKVKWAVHNFLALAGHFVSVIVFKTVYFFGKDRLLNKSYNIFCSNIPQGKQNK
jgi:rhamnosyltransferase